MIEKHLSRWFLYEQRQNNLSKARVEVVLSLAKALGCEIEDLID